MNSLTFRLWKLKHFFLNIVCRFQFRQTFKPETRLFLFRVTELIRLNTLIRAAAYDYASPLMHNRILNRDLRNIRSQQIPEETCPP